MPVKLNARSLSVGIVLASLIFGFQSLLAIELQEVSRSNLRAEGRRIGPTWTEHGKFNALVEVESGLAYLQDTAVVWSTEFPEGAITSFDKADFGLGGGTEFLVTTWIDPTSYLHEFYGDGWADQNSWMISPHIEDANQTDITGKATWVGFVSSWSPDRSKKVYFASNHHYHSQLFDEDAESFGGRISEFSITNNAVLRTWGGGQPDCVLEELTEADSSFLLLMVGASSSAAGGPNRSDEYRFEFTANQIDILADSTSKTLFRSFSMPTGPTGFPPPDKCRCTTISRGTDSSWIAMIEDLAGSPSVLQVFSFPEGSKLAQLEWPYQGWTELVAIETGDSSLLLAFFDNGWVTVYNPATLESIDSARYSNTPVVDVAFQDADGIDGNGLLYITGQELVVAELRSLGVTSPTFPILPAEYRLFSYPNPFNSSTTISYTLPKPGRYALDVVDIQGRLVTRLSNGWKEAGSYRSIFNGGELPSGTFMVKLEGADATAVQKIELLK